MRDDLIDDRGDDVPTMTKSELIGRLAERYPQLVAKDAEFAVRTILDAMARTLAEGRRIEGPREVVLDPQTAEALDPER
jgi:integration host factor subunit beta